MLLGVDKFGFIACVAAPEEKDEVVAVLVEILDNMLREGLPAFAAMAAGEMGFDGKDIVE